MAASDSSLQILPTPCFASQPVGHVNKPPTILFFFVRFHLQQSASQGSRGFEASRPQGSIKKFPSVKSDKGESAINQTTCALVSDGGLSPPWRSRVLVPIEQSSTDAIWDIKRSGHSSIQPCGQANIQGVPEHSSSGREGYRCSAAG